MTPLQTEHAALLAQRATLDARIAELEAALKEPQFTGRLWVREYMGCNSIAFFANEENCRRDIAGLGCLNIARCLDAGIDPLALAHQFAASGPGLRFLHTIQHGPLPEHLESITAQRRYALDLAAGREPKTTKESNNGVQ